MYASRTHGEEGLLCGSLPCMTFMEISAHSQLSSTTHPQAEDLAVRYVLQPLSEAETLELFAPAELR